MKKKFECSFQVGNGSLIRILFQFEYFNLSKTLFLGRKPIKIVLIEKKYQYCEEEKSLKHKQKKLDKKLKRD